MSARRERIRIDSLELSAHIGVTEIEREQPQRVTLSIALEPERKFAEMRDDLQHTVDYVAVCEAAQAITRERPRQLLETLGEDLAEGLLARFPIRALHLELRKYVLPDTAFVAVEVDRQKRVV